MTTTVYITIGNSDDKLTQLDWCSFVVEVDRAVSNAAQYVGSQVHGRWYSLPTEPWQNACWCITFHDELWEEVVMLKSHLGEVARTYRQDSIAWAEAQTEFIRARVATS